MATVSLNSTRLLTQQKVPFIVHQFPDTIHNANEVAEFVGILPERVYKTLLVLKKRPNAKPMLVMIAANQNLNLKLFAQAVKEKKVQMASRNEAEKITGLKVGGISALALLNKGFEIYIDESARQFETILVSAGRRGVNLEIGVTSLVKVTRAKWIEVI